MGFLLPIICMSTALDLACLLAISPFTLGPLRGNLKSTKCDDLTLFPMILAQVLQSRAAADY